METETKSTRKKPRPERKPRGHTTSVVLSGVYAAEGPIPGMRRESSGNVSDDMAFVICGIQQVHTYGPGSMPAQKMPETISAMGRVTADMLIPKEKRAEFAVAFEQLCRQHGA